MKKQASVKRISLQISAGSQSVNYQEVFTLDGHKLKIEVKSDSYRVQCYARIHVWGDVNKGWVPVHSVHHGSMETPEGLHHKPSKQGLEPHHFQADRNELLRVAREVVGA